jgi:hypothetical protein
MQIEWSDRYKALGLPYPDPETMCRGQCEGVGMYPVYLPEFDHRRADESPVSFSGSLDEPSEQERAAWSAVHDASKHETEGGRCDGWHFIKCPDCDGSGKRSAG